MLSIVTSQKIKQSVERILHVPGNFTADVLEMALVLDANVPEAKMKETVTELVKVLKGHSQVFKNVRLNCIEWVSDSSIKNNVVPMPVLQMGRYFDERTSSVYNAKYLENLFEYLRRFQARSKLIIVITDGNMKVLDNDKARMLMKPFLEKKIMFYVVKADSVGEALQNYAKEIKEIFQFRHMIME